MDTTTPNNPLTASDAAASNIETGVMMVCRDYLVTAIQDRRLQRKHLIVLACFVRVINLRSAKAWPSRSTLAQMSGFSEKTISNIIYELRGLNYLLTTKEPVEEANNRTLTVYAFGNIDHETIRRQITAFVDGLQAQRRLVDEAGTSLQAGKKSSPPAGNFPAQGEEKFPARRELPRPRGTLPPAIVPTHGELSPSTLPTSPPAGMESSSPVGNVPRRQGTVLTTTSVESNNSIEAEIPKRVRGTRLPDDWVLPRSWGTWAFEVFVASESQIRREGDSFRDYWIARTGKDATKADWQATWRNWIRNKKWRERRPQEFGGQADLLTVQQPEDIWAEVRKQQREAADD